MPLVQGFGVHHALNPDPYRGHFGADGKKYADDIKSLIECATPGGVAGIFAETIQVSLPLFAINLRQVPFLVRKVPYFDR
jgi:hypothetical protein